MTVTASTRRVAHVGNGVTTTFPVPFQFYEIDVYVNKVLSAPGVNYTITQSSPGAVGSVVFLTAPNGVVEIIGATVQTQEVDLVDNDSFPAEAHERALDRLTMAQQDLSLGFKQTIRTIPPAPPLPALDFEGSPNSFLFVDSGGVPVLQGVLDPASPFTAPVTQAAASASSASASATAALASKIAAAASEAAAAASFDNFDDRYLGPKEDAPTTDNDGDPLLEGAMYYNTTIFAMRVWNGSAWAAIGGGGGTITSIIAGTGIDVGSGPIVADGVIRLADMPAYTLKGNATAGSAVPSDLARTQLIAMLGLPMTGLEVDYHGLVAPEGWVMASGRTIGSAASVATERANADTEALFTLLWATYSDAVCPVQGGRGVSAAADFAANKTLTLPDKRGRVTAGLGNMGGASSGRLSVASGGVDGDVLGGGGQDYVMIQRTNLPNVKLGGATLPAGRHKHTYNRVDQNNCFDSGVGSYTSTVPDYTSEAPDHVHAILTDSLNGNVTQTKLPVVQPVWIQPKIIKL